MFVRWSPLIFLIAVLIISRIMNIWIKHRSREAPLDLF
ncbi:hypothetical protein JCM19240_922 [Vibrio maritimus]|uniref:Uncharacterized protein n=1 Tax=Vibrio maritimus TaxID=990268 RepID=A0A090T5L3_9VIBR|nr:hypothetical protein JCM19240_922 [Vibrio maritimus]